MLASVLLVLMVGLGGYLYLIKGSLLEYRELRQSRGDASAELDIQVRATDPELIRAMEGRVARHRDRLYGGAAGVSRREMESYVIDTLDRISMRHDVELASVTPSDTSSVLMFEELPYDVEVSGAYFRLFEWFRDAESELRPMVVKAFSIKKNGSETALAMDLRLVAYRPPEMRP